MIYETEAAKTRPANSFNNANGVNNADAARLPSMFTFYSVAAARGGADILACNEKTAEFGLTLTAEEARELAETRAAAVAANGRVEFGKSAVVSMIESFSASPYLDRYNYADSLNALAEAFYYFKSEIPDLPDAELLDFMLKAFDGVCGGDIDLLLGRELPRLSYNLRNGLPADEGAEPKLWENNIGFNKVWEEADEDDGTYYNYYGEAFGESDD